MICFGSIFRPGAASRLIEGNSPVAVIVAAALWLMLLAGLRPLMLPDEGRYVGVAWEMVSSGNWLVPVIDGLPYFHKPQLFYWISAAGMKILGVGEWAGRLPSLLAAILTVGGLFLFLRRYRSSRFATLATIILVTQPLFFFGAQFANLDMLVAGMISLTILSGADAILRMERNQPCRGALATAYAFAALGVLAKGLIGIVLPGGVLFFWLLWRRQWRLMLPMFRLEAILVFMLIALPWFYWMQHLYPGFYDYFVVYHHFKRFSETGFNNPQPFWFYLPVLLLLTLPWSLWIARAAGRNRQGAESDPLRSLMAIWLGLILAFFSLPSSKLVGYILPAVPPLAWFVAEVFSSWTQRDPDAAQRWFSRTLGAATFICAGAAIALVFAYKDSTKPLAESIRPVFAAGDQFVMVGVHRYDVPFYLRSSKPIWFVANWNDPGIPRDDDWRKELFDAGQFDPERAKTVLMTPPAFDKTVCHHASGALWILGTSRAEGILPWLKNQPVYARERQNVLWRLTPDTINTLPLCDGKPTAG